MTEEQILEVADAISQALGSEPIRENQRLMRDAAIAALKAAENHKSSHIGRTALPLKEFDEDLWSLDEEDREVARRRLRFILMDFWTEQLNDDQFEALHDRMEIFLRLKPDRSHDTFLEEYQKITDLLETFNIVLY